MKLHELKSGPGARRPRKRVGRGLGSGTGKTAGRGTKGQTARNTVRLGFEGGQTPLYRRLPQLKGSRRGAGGGFVNLRHKVYDIVNLGALNALEPGTVVTPELLVERKIITTAEKGLKVLGTGEIDRALTVRAHAFSKSALAKIEAAGGTGEVI
jgi:large subunit ribosomal protein L15